MGPETPVSVFPTPDTASAKVSLPLHWPVSSRSKRMVLITLSFLLGMFKPPERKESGLHLFKVKILQEMEMVSLT